MRPRNAGFTLVEMLVAIALLAILGVLSWRGMDYVATQRERLDRDTDELAAVLRVLSQLERDVTQRAPDFMLPAPAKPRALPPSIAVMPVAGGAVALEILRLAPGSGGSALLQRVIYRLGDSALVRSVSPAGSAWPPAPATNPLALLPGSQRFAVRALAGGFWFDPARPDTGVQPPVRATGLEISIEAADGARYVRILAL